ncbi:MAG TPA: CHASE2 domain-containing protein, partial [Geminicoccaceae bacterium]|nr:CHASE2 domain-containing protein [Geminicoccaceae bacterium]
MPRSTRALVVGAVTGALGVLFALTPLGLALERGVGLSGLFLLRGPIEPPADVVVVGIDRQSAQRLDLPAPPRSWPRSVHARLIESLADRGAAVIVLDLRLDIPTSEAEDAALARAIAAAKRVVLFEHLERTSQVITGGDGRATGHLTVDRLAPPIPAFAGVAAGLGPFPLPKTPTRVDRFWTFSAAAGDVPTLPAVALLLYALDDAYDPLLALLRRAGMPDVDGLPPTRADLAGADGVLGLCTTLRAALSADPALGTRLAAALASAPAGAGGLTGAQRRLLRALADLHGGPDSRYVNLYGPPGSVRTISYHAVLADDGAPLDVDGKAVFVGFSDLFATETKEDSFPTVFSRPDGVDISGVEIAATAFANLLDGRSVRPTGAPTTAALLLLVGGVAGAGACLLPAPPAVLLTLLIAALYLAGAHLAFGQADLWPPLAIPLLLQLPLALGWGLADRYRQVSRERRNIDRGARMYLPARLVQELTG